MRRQQKILIGATAFLTLLLTSCQKNPVDPAVKPEINQNFEAPTEDISNQLPFATKEPAKYSAKIVFSFRYDEAASNFFEQTYFVARDADNRRLDFELGERQISNLQLSGGKQLILLPKQKVYAELNAPQEKTDAKTLTNQPDDFSLEHLLSPKPLGATFVRIGEEEVLNRKTTKYQLNFKSESEAGNVRTETFVWADETLGLPIRTEVAAIENGVQTGAKNIVELREIKTEVEPQIFDVPVGFRKITFQEFQQILRQK